MKPYATTSHYDAIEGSPDQHASSNMWHPVYQEDSAFAPHSGYSAPSDWAGDQYNAPPSVDVPEKDVITREMRYTGRPWRSGVWLRLPKTGILALVGALASALSVVAILVSSDGKIVGTWAGGLQPNTFIAVFALLSNVLLTVAFAQGLTLSFWRQSLAGSSLPALHYHWRAGQSIPGAFQAIFKRQGFVNAIALLTLTVSIGRSPLNQAAAGIANEVRYDQNGTFQLKIDQRIPEGYTGISGSTRTSGPTTSTAITQNFSSIVRDYRNSVPMRLEHDECGDSCDTMINTFGFCATCKHETHSVNPRNSDIQDTITLFETTTTVWNQQPDAPYNDVNAAYNAGLSIYIIFLSGRAANGSSVQTNRTCLLQPSVMAVRVGIKRDDTVNLQGGWAGDTCIQPLNYTGPMAQWGGDFSTVGGFAYVMADMFDASAYFWNLGSTASVQFGGVVAAQYLESGQDGAANGNTDLVWNDPTDDILNTLRELAFRTSLFSALDLSQRNLTAIHSDPSLPADQVVAFTGSTTHTIYTTNRGFMAAGFVVSVIGILGVSILYRGWWELGRDVSMSPIEIARAFDAPLLRDFDGNAEVKDMVREASEANIRYGKVGLAGEGEGDPQPLRFDDANITQKPRDGDMLS